MNTTAIWSVPLGVFLLVSSRCVPAVVTVLIAVVAAVIVPRLMFVLGGVFALVLIAAPTRLRGAEPVF